MKSMKDMKLKLQCNYIILHVLHALHGKIQFFYESINCYSWCMECTLPTCPANGQRAQSTEHVDLPVCAVQVTEYRSVRIAACSLTLLSIGLPCGI
jgi:hypothetical protein